MERKSPFHKIDESIFHKIDTFKSSSLYSKYDDALEKLTDTQQRYTNILVSYIFIALPIIITIFILYGNILTRLQLSEKQNILDEIESFNATNMLITDMEKKLATTVPLNNKSNFLNRINNLASRASINQEDISVQSFQMMRNVGNLKESTAQITFKNLSTKQFSSFLFTLIRDKFSLSTLDVKKLEEVSSLEGTINLIVFGKNEQQQ